MFREGTFNFVIEILLANNNSEIQFHLTEIKLHLSKIIYPNNTRDIYLYIYSVSTYMG